MVKYLCSICNGKYDSFKEAEDCENKKSFGPEINPGVVLSHKKVDEGFFIIYNSIGVSKHNKVYHCEEIILLDHLIAPLWDFNISSSDLKKFLDNYILSSDEKVLNLNKLVQENFKGVSGIKVYMERYNIEKLHNNFKFNF